MSSHNKKQERNSAIAEEVASSESDYSDTESEYSNNDVSSRSSGDYSDSDSEQSERVTKKKSKSTKKTSKKDSKIDISDDGKPAPLVQCESFEEMGLKDGLLRGIYAYGFTEPSTIQKKAINVITSGRCVIAQSQSGTGKTGTFAISTLEIVDTSKNYCQGLILTHTREMAIQNHRVIKSLSQYIKPEPKICCCYGGSSVEDNIKTIKKGTHIVVGTPGRVYDMISRKVLDISKVKIFVLDEADSLLDELFRKSIFEIAQHLNMKLMQMAIFSATLPADVIELADKIMSQKKQKPVKILVKSEELTLEGIKQYKVCLKDERDKFETLLELYSIETITQCMIYCNTIHKATWLSRKLTENDHTVSLIHGKCSQQERNEIMENFKTGNTRVLITTDLLARGIDVQQVSLVINYDLPSDRENYIHRIGRTGRFGRKGKAINLIVPSDISNLEDIEKYYNTQVEKYSFKPTC